MAGPQKLAARRPQSTSKRSLSTTKSKPLSKMVKKPLQQQMRHPQQSKSKQQPLRRQSTAPFTSKRPLQSRPQQRQQRQQHQQHLQKHPHPRTRSISSFTTTTITPLRRSLAPSTRTSSLFSSLPQFNLTPLATLANHFSTSMSTIATTAATTATNFNSNLNSNSPLVMLKSGISTRAPVVPKHAIAAAYFNNSAPLLTKNSPLHASVRHFAAEGKSKKVNPIKKQAVKKPEMEEAEGGDEVFASAGDVKKNLRNWLEQILTSKPEILPMPQAAVDNEELFVQECQTRFAQRLDKRSRYEQAKIILKQRAIEQLPGELKAEALKDDPSLWSMQIMTPSSDPPRKRWLMEHYMIPFKASTEELESEEFLKKKYARL